MAHHDACGLWHCVHNVIVLCFCSYPNPSPSSYENRLFRPFQYALQPPPFYKEAHIAVRKPELPSGVQSLADYEGPQCFAIPGNHGVYNSCIYEFFFISTN